MPFRNLWVKEFRSIYPLFGIYSVLVILLHLLIRLKSSSLNEEVIMLSTLLPFIFGSLLALGTGYYQLFVEWRTNSIYLLLALPVRGWKVMMAKLTAVLAGLFLTLLVIGISFAVLLLSQKWGELDDGLPYATLLNITFHFGWMFVLTMIFLLALIQLAFLCGQLVSRFKWLAVFGTFLAVSWLVLRLSPLLAHLLSWTPEFMVGGKEADTVYFHSGPFLVLILLCVGLIALNGYIFEKEVEV